MEPIQTSTRQEHSEELDEVTETSLFREDLDADSLRAIEIVARLEKVYKIAISPEEMAQMINLMALYDVVKAHTEWDD